MNTAERAQAGFWTADEFLKTDQGEFGPAWRYELVRGRIVAHAAPSPEHGVIAAIWPPRCGLGYVGIPVAAARRLAAVQHLAASSATRLAFLT